MTTASDTTLAQDANELDRLGFRGARLIARYARKELITALTLVKSSVSKLRDADEVPEDQRDL